MNKTNWFKRHLNWTWIFGYGLLWILPPLGGILAVVVSPETTEEALYSLAGLLYFLVLLVVVLPLSIWVLKKKGRSLWWLLGLGWLTPLWLANKHTQGDVWPTL